MRNQIDQKSLYVERSGDKEIYYSYNTTVAIRTPLETYVSENVWSVTTAKHLNKIDVAYRELENCDYQYMVMKSILNNFNEKQLKIILKGTKMMVKAERLEEKTNVAMGQQ